MEYMLLKFKYKRTKLQVITRDENGWRRTENSSPISVSVFLTKTWSGLGKNGIENGWGHTEIWKQTNTDGEPEN